MIRIWFCSRSISTSFGTKASFSGIPSTTGQAAQRSVCEFTGGVLNGMQIVMTAATNADVHIFTKEYLEKDPGMKKYIGG